MKWIVFHPVPVFRSRRCPPGLFLLPLPHAVNRIVRRDSIDPGTKIRSRRKLPQLLVATQECLLDHLFGILAWLPEAGAICGAIEFWYLGLSNRGELCD